MDVHAQKGPSSGFDRGSLRGGEEDVWRVSWHSSPRFHCRSSWHRFLNNHAGEKGGVIEAQENTTIIIEGGNFTENRADEVSGIMLL